MVDIQQQVSGMMPEFGGILTIGTTLIILSIVIAIVGVVTYFIVYRMKQKYKIIIWEQFGENWMITGRDRAMELRVGDGGDTCIKLVKRKKILPFPSYQVQKRTYFYYILPNGEWYNPQNAKFNKNNEELAMEIQSRSMGYARTELQQNFKDRYESANFWDKYGNWIMSISFIIIIAIAVWLIMDKWVDLASTLNSMVAQMPELLEKQGEILTALENVCQGGSGIRLNN